MYSNKKNIKHYYNLKPLVSVIIPTYKRSTLIERALKSVINQTYKNIEIIIVDDNGTNEYRKKTKKRIEKYIINENVKYIEHKKNKGGSEARNTGIRHANGKFITFLDDDDYYLPNRIEFLLKNFEIDKYDAIISSMYRENLAGQRLNIENNFCKGRNLKEFILEGNIYTGMIFIKKEFIKKINGFDFIPRFQDKLFMLKFYENNGKSKLIKDQLHVMLEHKNERITYQTSKLGRYSHHIIYEKIKKHQNLFTNKEWRKVKYKYYYGLASVSAQGKIKDKILCFKYFLISLTLFVSNKNMSKCRLLFRCFTPIIIYEKTKKYLNKWFY